RSWLSRTGLSWTDTMTSPALSPASSAGLLSTTCQTRAPWASGTEKKLEMSLLRSWRYTPMWPWPSLLQLKFRTFGGAGGAGIAGGVAGVGVSESSPSDHENQPFRASLTLARVAFTSMDSPSRHTVMEAWLPGREDRIRRVKSSSSSTAVPLKRVTTSLFR